MSAVATIQSWIPVLELEYLLRTVYKEVTKHSSISVFCVYKKRWKAA